MPRKSRIFVSASGCFSRPQAVFAQSGTALRECHSRRPSYLPVDVEIRYAGYPHACSATTSLPTYLAIFGRIVGYSENGHLPKRRSAMTPVKSGSRQTETARAIGSGPKPDRWPSGTYRPKAPLADLPAALGPGKPVFQGVTSSHCQSANDFRYLVAGRLAEENLEAMAGTPASNVPAGDLLC
jgi:hypothetical protein